jgi:hypothetical protein
MLRNEQSSMHNLPSVYRQLFVGLDVMNIIIDATTELEVSLS